jgi:hypothetical protein
MKGRLIIEAFLAPAAVCAQNTTDEGLLSSGNVDLGEWAGVYAKATAFVAQLTNEEKITIIAGAPSVFQLTRPLLNSKMELRVYKVSS